MTGSQAARQAAGQTAGRAVPRRRPVRLEIDAEAITRNTRLLERRAPAGLLAVVKGDGYGHGAQAVARAALRGGASWIGVTGMDEAVRLREAGVAAPILSWLHTGPVDVELAQAESVDVAISSFDDLDVVAERGRGLRVQFDVDTGLGREGFAEADWERAVERLSAAHRRGRIRVVGLMSHLSHADVPGSREGAAQRASFERAHDLLRMAGLQPSVVHLAATSAVLTSEAPEGTLSRVGAGLVGIDLTGTADLLPAMTLTAPLLDVREVEAGSPSGYGHLWRAERRTLLGIVPVGYADGLPRAAAGQGSRAEVLVGGRRASVVGAMSMNALVVELGSPGDGGPLARAGDEVTVFGGSDPAPTVSDWARWASTLPQEIVTAVGRALPRTLVNAGCDGPANAGRLDRRTA